MNAGRHDTWICMATGPSLTQADVDYCRGKARVIAIKDNYRLAPWADVLYSGDIYWWEHHIGQINASFSGERWTCREDVAQEHDLDWTNLEPEHAGHQAVQLADLFGARRIVLLGYDMKATEQKHWFGNHPASIGGGHPLESHPFEQWIEGMKDLIEDLKARGKEVINCTRDTALGYRVPLESVL